MEKSQFTQYPHIENIEEVPGLFELPEVIVTEKVHGSSMRVAVLDSVLRLGGRKLEFTEINPTTREGLCFIQWVLDTGLDQKVLETFRGHNVIVYGEWHGSGNPKKNWPQIQKGIRYINGVDFRIFDVKVDGKYVSFDDIAGWAAKVGLKTMPVLYRGKPDQKIFDSLIDTMSRVGEENGIVDPENTIEGLVIRPPVLIWDTKRVPIMAKYKVGKWAERASQQRHPKVQPKVKVIPPGAEAFAKEFVTDTRLDHILDQLRQEGIAVGTSAMGEVMKRMGQDIKREGEKTLDEAQLEWKDVSPFVTKFTKEIFMKYLQNSA
ncbi:MAG: hypothetical protein HY465_01940 [Deltaproteobacteria bacterium]|nr:hypothetical protein [Deltaproteobacteria bacterium]